MPDYTPNFAGVIDALRTIIQNGIADGSGGGGGGGSGAEIKAAIETATNLDGIESNQAIANNYLQSITDFNENIFAALGTLADYTTLAIGAPNGNGSVIGGYQDVGNYLGAIIVANGVTADYPLYLFQGVGTNLQSCGGYYMGEDSLSLYYFETGISSSFVAYVPLLGKDFDLIANNGANPGASFSGNVYFTKKEFLPSGELSSIKDYLNTLSQSVTYNLGQTTDAVASSDVEGSSVISLLKRLLSVKFGEDITGTTIPTGGSGIRGLLSWVAQLISDRLPTSLGSKTSALSFPITLSPDGIFATNFGNPSDAVATNDSGTFTFLGLFKRLLSTTQSILSSLPSSTKPSLVRSLLKKWREEFSGNALDPTAWTVVQTGSGQTIVVTGSELRITTGTTINAETIIKGLATFTIPFRVQFQCYLSQRITNQEFYLEIVDASGNSKASILLDGTNTILAKLFSTNAGIAGTTFSNSGFLITTSYSILDLEISDDEVTLYSKATDTIAGRSPGAAITTTRKLPDPNLEYYLQIRVKNLSSAPASTTTIFLDSIVVTDNEELAAEIVSARGGSSNTALAVTFPTIPTVNVNNSVTVSSVFSTVTTAGISNRDYTSNTVSVTPLAANANYIGGATGVANLNKIRGWVYADQTGVLSIDFARDTTNWRVVQTINYTTPNTLVTFEQALSGVNYRVRFNNGATAQTIFELNVTQFGIGA